MTAAAVRAASRRRRALFVSSPIGLGHARRDVAIARELRALVPDLEIDWLAQDPVTRVLEADGERIHPESRHRHTPASRRALSIFENALGTEHPKTRACRAELEKLDAPG